MKTPPKNPRIYHIVHVDNLASIVRQECLYSDVQIRRRNLAVRGIGYSHIKERRLKRVVEVAAGGTLGEYVPFNFCPRSVMLYVVGQGHDGYDGGQSPVVHLVSSFESAVATGQPWAFTDRHADLQHALYFEDRRDLGQVDWAVMPLEQWGGQTRDQGTPPGRVPGARSFSMVIDRGGRRARSAGCSSSRRDPDCDFASPPCGHQAGVVLPLRAEREANG